MGVAPIMLDGDWAVSVAGLGWLDRADKGLWWWEEGEGRGDGDCCEGNNQGSAVF